ncbi:MAG: hypothetical protein ABI468_02355 [Candidatus Nanopelagicales bacterium]
MSVNDAVAKSRPPAAGPAEPLAHDAIPPTPSPPHPAVATAPVAGAAVTGSGGTLGRHDVGSNPGLLLALAAVDERGWDGGDGTAVLTYARLRVVRPQVHRAGLSGPAANQAEATGWAVAWELLSSRALRAAGSPWGVVSVAVRRAVLGEVVAAVYGTGVREAWRLAAGSPRPGRPGDALAPVRRPVSLSMLDPDWCAPTTGHVFDGIGPRLEVIATAMVRAGWSREEAVAVCEWVAYRAHDRSVTKTPGWRTLARLLGIPAWRARRATVLLLGSTTWPGLVERVASEGSIVLQRPDVLAAVRSTVVASHLSPVGASKLALRRCDLAVQRERS